MTSAEHHLTIAKDCALRAKSLEAVAATCDRHGAPAAAQNRRQVAAMERAAEAQHRAIALMLTPGH